jgi:outer membrane murein-binding lipoprotein Lpp
MKHIKLTIALLLIAIMATRSSAQKQTSTSAVDTLNRRIEKLEKEFNENSSQLRSAESRANFAYGKAVDADEKLFHFEKKIWWVSYNWMTGAAAILGFILGFFGSKEYMKRKAKERIDQFLENKEWSTALNDKIEKQVTENKLRANAKIIVINHQATPFSLGFKKVLGLFGKFDLKNNMKNFVKLSDALADSNIAEFKTADLVIIENQDIKMQWKIGNVVPSNELILEISKAGTETQDDLNNEHQNQAIMINLINKICDETALVYYGPGVLQSTKADPNKQHLVAFANSPSTLFSNIMNLLKFKDILENEQEKA